MLTLTRFRDVETGSHLHRVAQYAKLIAMEMGPKHSLSDDYIQYLFMFTPLHDIGKIGVPDHVLHKPGKLNAAEFNEIKKHPEEGHKIVTEILSGRNILTLELIEMAQNIVLYHHERWDGKGYPEGLAGKDIPLEARIVALADVCDALTCERPYKQAWPLEKVFDFLAENSGSQFDPECVTAFMKLKSKIININQIFDDEKA